MHDLVRVRRSPIQGRGVFARVPIKKGTRVIEYEGERITDEEANDRYFDDDRKKRHHTFLFTVDERRVIDATRVGNEAKYINHSCDPNCESVVERRRFFIYATRDIAAGEELTYDYWYSTDESYTDADRRRIYPCFCGTAKCRGTLAAPQEKKRRATKRKKR